MPILISKDHNLPDETDGILVCVLLPKKNPLADRIFLLPEQHTKNRSDKNDTSEEKEEKYKFDKNESELLAVRKRKN